MAGEEMIRGQIRTDESEGHEARPPDQPFPNALYPWIGADSWTWTGGFDAKVSTTLPDDLHPGLPPGVDLKDVPA